MAVAANVLDVEPAATVTEAGTERLGLFSDKVTSEPPAGAGRLSVTVQVLEPGVGIEGGEQLSVATWTGVG
ncbi:MAG: hypothetical protein ACKV22_32030 [Bryobacteraceae bacterium]